MLRKILVTGANGFIGRNLLLKLDERKIEYLVVTRNTSSDSLQYMVMQADCIVHLAASNRPENKDQYIKDNVGFTRHICNLIKSKKEDLGRNTHLIYTSSVKAIKDDSNYGKSKRMAEIVIEELLGPRNIPYSICRLPNVFGKWCKPNYNSVIATFAYNIHKGLDLKVDKGKEIELCHIDDVVECIVDVALNKKPLRTRFSVSPTYHRSVEFLASRMKTYRKLENENRVVKYIDSFDKKLFGSYLSYKDVNDDTQVIEQFIDKRGRFAELLKFEASGQISLITIAVGQSRGDHYHHLKCERFYVVKGSVLFTFYNILEDRYENVEVSENNLQVIWGIPGWNHRLENIGDSEAIILLWSSEEYVNEKPDTFRI